mmetsp:Transcript_49010/g.115137  ORF Transcript_49010/g.115137 Transcript_49010/m.115137 type:complete len:407 (-) Transcript_49010:717-1937(-)
MLASVELQALVGQHLARAAHAALLDHAQALARGGHQPGGLQHLGQAHRRAAELHRGDVVRDATLGAVVEIRLGRIGRRSAVEARGDLLGQRHLGVLGVAPRLHLRLELGDVGDGLEGQQLVPLPHLHIADGQHLGEHGVGRLCDADVVVLGLGHLLDAVQPLEQRHGQDALRLLAILLLQMAPHQQVELLVGAAELQVGLQRHRVIALHQRVEEFVHRNRRLALEALGEVVALQHPGHGVLGGQLDHAGRAQGLAPLGVVADLGPGRVQHQLGLGVVGLGVGLDLFLGQRRAGGVAAGGVADQGGEVADQEDHLVTQVLQLAHLVQHHGVADVDVRGGRVQAQLDAQRHAGGSRTRQLLRPLGLRQQLADAAARDGQGFEDGVGDGVFGGDGHGALRPPGAAGRLC